MRGQAYYRESWHFGRKTALLKGASLPCVKGVWCSSRVCVCVRTCVRASHTFCTSICTAVTTFFLALPFTIYVVVRLLKLLRSETSKFYKIEIGAKSVPKLSSKQKTERSQQANSTLSPGSWILIESTSDKVNSRETKVKTGPWGDA